MATMSAANWWATTLYVNAVYVRNAGCRINQTEMAVTKAPPHVTAARIPHS